ncbi:MAG: hypothetical protein M0Z84_10590 [Gammaproteobacteria bacterium]|nr:hypothetical protein [Gammaproteobacteria bacterium]
MDDGTSRGDTLRRVNRRTATVLGLIALGLFLYTIVRGFFR